MPQVPGEISPDWLTAVLCAAGLSPGTTVTGVDWEAIGEDRGFTGVVARVRPRYGDEHSAETAPVSLVAKFPIAERTAASTYRSAQSGDPAAARIHLDRSVREVRFYREVAPRLSAPAPRIYFAEANGELASIVILMEDLAGARAGDVLAGCSIQDAALVLDAMAPFHARGWKNVGLDSLPWLPRWGSDPVARQDRYARQVKPFLERFGDRIPPSIRVLIERLSRSYASVLTELNRAPATVIHADLHLDNIMFTGADLNPRAVVLDWQGVALGPVAVDVAYLLVGALGIEERRIAEADLLRDYHRLLCVHGVTGYEPDRLREEMRLALVWQLAGMVGWLARADPDTVEGRERALLEAAIGDGRLIAALLDYDVARLVTAL